MSRSNDETTPNIIKKYANRRLYNTETSTYVTLDDLAELVKAEKDFVVQDAKSGEDITRSVLTQIIFEQESRGQNLLPVRFLRQLIRFYGDSMQSLVPSYLEMSLESLTQEQEKYRRQFAEAFGGGAAFEAMEEQARQNMAMFEKALAMFSPFTPPGEGEGEPSEAKPDKPAAKKETESDDLAALKAQLADMQDKLEKLSK